VKVRRSRFYEIPKSSGRRDGDFDSITKLGSLSSLGSSAEETAHSESGALAESTGDVLVQ